MNPREIFEELLKPNGRPERQLKQYEAFGFVWGGPIGSFLRPGIGPGKTGKDAWGVTILWEEGAPGAMPLINAETVVCPDITRWREVVHAPDLLAHCSDGWEGIQQQVDAIHAAGKLTMVLMGGGMFEQCHYLMGFENTLTAFYEHPDEMHALIDYIFEYRMTYLKLLVEKVHPDAILSHDDWGTKNALFMQPEVWREFFKEPYRKFYAYMRQNGIIAVHHADSYLAPIVEDMAEIGIRCWQGVLPENDIPALQRRLAGRMILMGGIGAAIDRPDAEGEEIAAYTRAVLEECCPGGHFIPCITYGLPGTVYKHVDPFIDREIDAYNAVLHLHGCRPAQPARRLAAAPAAAAQQTVPEQRCGSDTLETIAAALQKGQKKRTCRLCEQALAEGIPAQRILSEGLVLGMNRLGDDFTASRVFVPEMLLAARCMTAATALLKPRLVAEGGKAAGRVCLGTVKGDMHDIGKNLVKLMMEGSGLEVVDLGVDVPAEAFVEAARVRQCDIIACSSLLTTTMAEMRRVVQIAEESGIRHRVKIMVGGAPITQAFCEEIGADIYTADAAAAAKAAVAALAG